MGWTSASLRHITIESVHSAHAQRELNGLDNRLAELSNDISGLASTLTDASHQLAVQLGPVLLAARQHEEAARGPIESLVTMAHQNSRGVEGAVVQLNQGRVHRQGFQPGSAFVEQADRLSRETYAAWDQLGSVPVLGQRSAEACLDHAEGLVQQIKNRLG